MSTVAIERHANSHQAFRAEQGPDTKLQPRPILEKESDVKNRTCR